MDIVIDADTVEELASRAANEINADKELSEALATAF